MKRIVTVVALPGYRLQLNFADGVSGAVDLSDLVGTGVFSTWEKPGSFEQVRINPQTHTVEWPGGVDLCPDALYADIVATPNGKSRDLMN